MSIPGSNVFPEWGQGGPPARRGSPFLPRTGEKEGRGRCPLDPGVYGPLTLVRSFWGSLSLIRSRGYYFRYPKTDLGRIFEGKYAGKHFRERKFPNQGAYLGPETAQRPFRCAPTLKAFPLGGRWAGKAGSDEGAILYPTFPCRKGAHYRLSPQRNFSSAPLGKPVAPSSVTFGDSFPPKGKPLGCAALHEKASQIRARTWATKQPNYRPAAPHHAKTSERQQAGH